MQRRAKALEHLPGPKPKYWLPGFMALIVRKDPHRYSTVLAERFGPIFKFRVLCFHVSALRPCRQHDMGCMSLTGLSSSAVHFDAEACLVLRGCCSLTEHSSANLDVACLRSAAALTSMHSLQVVCITDPVLATHVLRSKHVDKLRFQYSFLDPVSLCPHILLLPLTSCPAALPICMEDVHYSAKCDGCQAQAFAAHHRMLIAPKCASYLLKHPGVA